MYAYIYVIGPEIGRQKIGYSEDPDRRLISVQTGNPDKLYLHHYVQVDNPAKARLIESEIHRELKHLRSRGEWFDITVSEAKSEVDFAYIRYNDDTLLGKYK